MLKISQLCSTTEKHLSEREKVFQQTRPFYQRDEILDDTILSNDINQRTNDIKAKDDEVERMLERSDTYGGETQSFGDGAFESASFKQRSPIVDTDSESSLEYIPIRINPYKRDMQQQSYPAMQTNLSPIKGRSENVPSVGVPKAGVKDHCLDFALRTPSPSTEQIQAFRQYERENRLEQARLNQEFQRETNSPIQPYKKEDIESPQFQNSNNFQTDSVKNPAMYQTYDQRPSKIQAGFIEVPITSSTGFKLTLTSNPLSSIVGPMNKSAITQMTNTSSLGWHSAHETNASPDLDERLERLRNRYQPSNEISQSICYSSPETKPLDYHQFSELKPYVKYQSSEPIAKTPAYYYQEKMKTPSPPKRKISAQKKIYNTSVKKQTQVSQFEVLKQPETKLETNLTKKLICQMLQNMITLGNELVPQDTSQFPSSLQIFQRIDRARKGYVTLQDLQDFINDQGMDHHNLHLKFTKLTFSQFLQFIPKFWNDSNNSKVEEPLRKIDRLDRKYELRFAEHLMRGKEVRFYKKQIKAQNDFNVRKLFLEMQDLSFQGVDSNSIYRFCLLYSCQCLNISDIKRHITPNEVVDFEQFKQLFDVSKSPISFAKNKETYISKQMIHKTLKLAEILDLKQHQKELKQLIIRQIELRQKLKTLRFSLKFSSEEIFQFLSSGPNHNYITTESLESLNPGLPPDIVKEYMTSQWQNHLYFKEFQVDVVGKRDELVFLTKYLDRYEELSRESIDFIRQFIIIQEQMKESRRYFISNINNNRSEQIWKPQLESQKVFAIALSEEIGSKRKLNQFISDNRIKIIDQEDINQLYG